MLGTVVSLLVRLDVYGELCHFRRGARESRDLLAALDRSLNPPNRDEGLRILIDYTTLLADLPSRSEGTTLAALSPTSNIIPVPTESEMSLSPRSGIFIDEAGAIIFFTSQSATGCERE